MEYDPSSPPPTPPSPSFTSEGNGRRASESEGESKEDVEAPGVVAVKKEEVEESASVLENSEADRILSKLPAGMPEIPVQVKIKTSKIETKKKKKNQTRRKKKN